MGNLPRLGYTRLGCASAQPLAIIHGWGCDSRFLMPLANMFLDRDVYLIDLPGYGKSKHLAALAEDFQSTCYYLINTIPLGADVLAWSFSTLFALRALEMLANPCHNFEALLQAEHCSGKLPNCNSCFNAALGACACHSDEIVHSHYFDHQEAQHTRDQITRLAEERPSILSHLLSRTRHPINNRVRSLVTVCGSPRFPSDPNWAGMSAIRVLKCNTALTPRRLDMIMGMFLRMHMSELNICKRDQEYLLKLTAHKPQIDPKVLMAGIRLISFLDEREALRHLTIPSLHLFGHKDSLVPSSIAPSMSKPPLHKTFIFEHSFHTPYLSEPELFKQVVTEFYQGIHNFDAPKVCKESS